MNRYDQIKTARLVAFIRSHGHLAIPRPDGLRVRSIYSTKEGRAFRQWDTIPATNQAARAWLGY